MEYNAVILAGGRGTRLSPVTDTIPKPLAQIAGRSAFERILDLLADNGVSHAAVTTGYMKEKLKQITHSRVKLTFFDEDEPLGTAGGVKNAESALSDTFIVISGDALCDFDLRAAVEKHIKAGANATVLLTRSAFVLEYGSVMLDKDGYITRFIEKPPVSKAISDLINSGIYILNKSVLNMIEENKFCDFSKDLFPKIMSREKIFSVVCDGYWCDIGDLSAFYRCNEDAFSGKLHMSGARSATGKNFSLGKKSKLIGTVVGDNVDIGDNSIVYASILCDGAKIGSGCRISKGCVIGADAVVGDGVKLPASTRVPPGKRLSSYFPSAGGIMLYEGCADCNDDAALLFELGYGAGKAIGGQIGVLYTDSEKASGKAVPILTAGIRAAGCDAVIIGEGTAAKASFIIGALALRGAMVAHEDGVTIYDRFGLTPSRELERKIVSSAAGYKKLPEAQGSECDAAVLCDALYKRELSEFAAKYGLSEEKNKPEWKISPDGTGIMSEKHPFYVLLYLCLIEAVERGIRQLALEASAPLLLVEALVKHGASVLHYSRTPSDDKEDKVRERVMELRFLRDGQLLSLLLSSYLCRKSQTLDQAVKAVPFYSATTEKEYYPELIAGAARRLSESEHSSESADGIRLTYSQGSVVVVPSIKGFRLFAESVNAEAAQELCSRVMDEIDKLPKNNA